MYQHNFYTGQVDIVRDRYMARVDKTTGIKSYRKNIVLCLLWTVYDRYKEHISTLIFPLNF